ncbi:MAG TPA: hypothetical protein VHS09_16735 [Polyangiaceae bacterium]|nr:hypothetical protein [Polyangiaceae bacterium]
MRARVAILLPAVALSLASCRGSPPTVAPTAPVAPTAHPAALVAPAPAPDLSPVPAPGGLGVTIHLAHPRTTFQQLASVVGPVAAMLAGGAKLDPESLVTLAVGAPVGALVDLDQPIDVAVSDLDTPEESLKIAASVALVDPVAAREGLEKYYEAQPTAPGVVRLAPRDDAPDGASPRPCALVAAAGGDAGGPPTTRLVCGDGEDAVRHLGPYLTRTMTRLASHDDLRVEVFVKGLHPPKSGEKVLTPAGPVPVDGGTVDPADEMLDELTEKLMADVGSVVLEASSDGTAVDVRLSTSVVDTSSPLTKALVGAGTASAPPPAAFERLPREASFAWYGRGATAADLAPLRASLLGSLRTWLADDGYAPDAVDTQLAPFQRILTGGPWVVASGLRFGAARAALDAYADSGKTTPAARAKARAAMQGWVVGAVEEPAQGWIDDVRELVKNDAVKPTGKPVRKHRPNKESTRLALAPAPAALQLPAGTLHVEARVTANPEWALAQKKAGAQAGGLDPVHPHTMHFFVVPDGARTWFAAAEDAALAATEVRASLSGAPDAGTLVARRDLDALRAMPASTAGFLSAAGVATWLRSEGSDEGIRKARETLLGLAGLTDHGATPIPVALTAAHAASGPGGEVRLRFVFPIRLGLEVAASAHAVF